MAYLRVQSTPTRANVLINGKPSGVTPTDYLEVDAKQKLLIEVSHEQSEKTVQEVTLDKGARKTLNLNLVLKTANLSVTTDPTEAQVFVFNKDQEQVFRKFSPTGMMKLEPGKYSIRVEKDGYETAQSSVTLKGKEQKVMPLIRLKKIDNNAASTEKPQGSVAKRWVQYVYRGFVAVGGDKNCYEAKKSRLQELIEQKESPAFQQLKLISQKKKGDYPEGQALVEELTKLEECVK